MIGMTNGKGEEVVMIVLAKGLGWRTLGFHQSKVDKNVTYDARG